MQDFQKAPKKRVLLVGEFSQLNTGFSVMANDLLTEMQKSGKYEVAELASYVGDGDERLNNVPWKVYPVIPAGGPELEDYSKNYKTSQFGSQRFERTVIDFKPDIIFSYRDFWHDEWITKSPSRYLYNYIWSACVDSEPPRSEWIGVFSSVDKVSSYTDWGLSVLKEYAGRNTNVAEINTMPGVDQNVFKPMPKAKARETLGIKDDINIVLTVMRNQPRKLFPDLMYAFSNTLEEWRKIGRQDLVDKTYLYLHTSYPDVGFDIGKDIVRYKLGSKVLMTYCCNHCGHYFASFFNGDVCTCHNCGNYTAHPPNTAMGVTRQQLATVYNTADLYVQLSVAGALEIPLIEAKACGVPTVATDYAAMRELNNMGGSYGAIKVAYWREESDKETGQIRAMPDPLDCSDKIKSFFLQSPEYKDALSKNALSVAATRHSNAETFAKWDRLFDSMPELPAYRWALPPNKIDAEDIKTGEIFNDEDFVDYLAFKFTPPKCSFRSFAARKEMAAMLKSKVKNDNGQNSRMNRNDVVNIVKEIVKQFNSFEDFRFMSVNGIKNEKRMVEVV